MKKVTCFADFGVLPAPPEHLTPEEKAQWWYEFDMQRYHYYKSLNLPHADEMADAVAWMSKFDDYTPWKKA
jgi:hypothetical protein